MCYINPQAHVQSEIHPRCCRYGKTTTRFRWESNLQHLSNDCTTELSRPITNQYRQYPWKKNFNMWTFLQMQVGSSIYHHRPHMQLVWMQPKDWDEYTSTCSDTNAFSIM